MIFQRMWNTLILDNHLDIQRQTAKTWNCSYEILCKYHLKDLFSRYWNFLMYCVQIQLPSQFWNMFSIPENKSIEENYFGHLVIIENVLYFEIKCVTTAFMTAYIFISWKYGIEYRTFIITFITTFWFISYGLYEPENVKTFLNSISIFLFYLNFSIFFFITKIFLASLCVSYPI